MLHLLYGGTYHRNKVTHWMLGEILLIQRVKKKHWPRNESRGEVGPSWYFKAGDVPWILKKDDLSLEKEVILGVKVPSLYGSTLRCCFTMEDHLSELKSRDHLNLLRLHISKT